MKLMQIGDVARQLEMPASTIRYYERIGLLSAPRRENGRRLYSKSILNQLRFIRVAQQMGHTLDEIKTLSLRNPGHENRIPIWQEQVANKMIEIDQKIAALQQMKARLRDSLDCMCTSLDSCLMLQNS